MTSTKSLFAQFADKRASKHAAESELPENLKSPHEIFNRSNIQTATQLIKNSLDRITKLDSQARSGVKLDNNIIRQAKQRFGDAIQQFNEEKNKMPDVNPPYANNYQKMIHDNYIQGQQFILRDCLIQFSNLLTNQNSVDDTQGFPEANRSGPDIFQASFNQALQTSQINNEAYNQIRALSNELRLQTEQLHLMILDQGTIIDRIETQLTTACAHMERGNDILERVGVKTRMTYRDEFNLNKGFYCIMIVLLIMIIFCGSVIIMKKAMRANKKK